MKVSKARILLLIIYYLVCMTLATFVIWGMWHGAMMSNDIRLYLPSGDLWAGIFAGILLGGLGGTVFAGFLSMGANTEGY